MLGPLDDLIEKYLLWLISVSVKLYVSILVTQYVFNRYGLFMDDLCINRVMYSIMLFLGHIFSLFFFPISYFILGEVEEKVRVVLKIKK